MVHFRFTATAATTVVTILASLILLESAWATDSQAGLKSAARLFSSGEFSRAAKAYRGILAKNPNEQTAVLRLGQIALLENRWEDAEKRLTVAARLGPDDPLSGDKEPKRLLAELYYRELRFQKAAPLFRELGNEGMARKLERCSTG